MIPPPTDLTRTPIELLRIYETMTLSVAIVSMILDVGGSGLSSISNRNKSMNRTFQQNFINN
jgi:hypothetical protein